MTGWLDSIAESHLASQLLNAAALRASLNRALAAWDGVSDVWLFAYGSLIWNPQLAIEQQRTGTVHGYHRSLCLWSRINRGTPQEPGLVLALARGGSCAGLAYRIAAGRVRGELAKLWEREMLLGSYRPAWVSVRCGSEALPALTFVIDPRCSGYAGRLDDATVLRALNARGRYGTCADYLRRTVESLAMLGIRDRRLTRLAAMLAKL